MQKILFRIYRTVLDPLLFRSWSLIEKPTEVIVTRKSIASAGRKKENKNIFNMMYGCVRITRLQCFVEENTTSMVGYTGAKKCVTLISQRNVRCIVSKKCFNLNRLKSNVCVFGCVCVGACGCVCVRDTRPHRWTDPSQILHGLLIFKGGGHRGIKDVMGVPKRGAHLMPKNEKWPKKG